MSSLKVNVIANYAGQIWTAIMMIAFIPLYLEILGAESFGLVGIMLSLQAISQMFDFGVGGAVNRELATRVGNRERVPSAANLIRTLEWVVWPMALMVGGLISLSSEWISTVWLSGQQLSVEELESSLIIIGVVVACLWPSNFYLNCLSGLEKQPLMNVITASFTTLRSVGVLPVLFFLAPTISAFLWWNVVVAVLQTLLLAVVVWHTIGTRRLSLDAKFSFDELASVAKFASGMFLITVLALVLTQVDRLMLSGLSPLSELGYYTVALSVAAGIGKLIQPMFTALYPRFSRLHAAEDDIGLTELYRQSCQWSSVILSAAGAVLIVFSEQILYLWTGDADTSVQLRCVLAVLVAGTVLNGLVTIPYALQLAKGWTRLSVGVNAVSVLFAIPFCYQAINSYGMLGAASLCLVLNVTYVFVAVPLMHQKLLPGGWLRWFFNDTFPIVCTAIITALACSFLLPETTRDLIGVLWLGLVCSIVGLAAMFSSSVVRRFALEKLQLYFGSNLSN